MTAPAVSTCGTCLGETTVVVEQRGVDVEVGYPGCRCFCGAEPIAPGLMCERCEDAAVLEFDRRAERRADV
jgi:hypothetical protein